VQERTEQAAQSWTRQAKAGAEMPPLREAEAVKGAALQRLLHERNSLDAEETRAREDAQRVRQRLGVSEQDLAREGILDEDARTALAALENESREFATAD